MIHPPKQGESQSESFGNPGDSGFARNALVGETSEQSVTFDKIVMESLTIM
jgi:hypothetical protein